MWCLTFFKRGRHDVPYFLNPSSNTATHMQTFYVANDYNKCWTIAWISKCNLLCFIASAEGNTSTELPTVNSLPSLSASSSGSQVAPPSMPRFDIVMLRMKLFYILFSRFIAYRYGQMEIQTNVKWRLKPRVPFCMKLILVLYTCAPHEMELSISHTPWPCGVMSNNTAHSYSFFTTNLNIIKNKCWLVLVMFVNVRSYWSLYVVMFATDPHQQLCSQRSERSHLDRPERRR